MPISGSYVFCGEKKKTFGVFKNSTWSFKIDQGFLKRLIVHNLFFVKLSIMSYLNVTIMYFLKML